MNIKIRTRYGSELPLTERICDNRKPCSAAYRKTNIVLLETVDPMSQKIPHDPLLFASTVLLWNVAPVWEDLLRAAFDDPSFEPRINVLRCPGSEDPEAHLSENRTAFLIAEWDAHPVDCLQVLRRLMQRFTRMRFALIAHQDERGSNAIEREAAQIARELGAVLAVNSTRQLPQLLDVIRRHAEQTVESPRTLLEEIESSLPWSKGAST